MFAQFFVPRAVAARIMTAPDVAICYKMFLVVGNQKRLSLRRISDLIREYGTVFTVRPSNSLNVATNVPQVIMGLLDCGAILDRLVEDPYERKKRLPMKNSRRSSQEIRRKVRVDRKRRPPRRLSSKKQLPYCRTEGKAIRGDDD